MICVAIIRTSLPPVSLPFQKGKDISIRIVDKIANQDFVNVVRRRYELVTFLSVCQKPKVAKIHHAFSVQEWRVSTNVLSQAYVDQYSKAHNVRHSWTSNPVAASSEAFFSFFHG